MTSNWGWKPERTYGIWRHGAGWLKPIFAAAPYLTVIILALTMYFASNAITASEGILFDLPDRGECDAASAELVALVMPMKRDTLVFFDDSRYVLDDEASRRSFGEHLAERARRGEKKTLLILADRRVEGGKLLKLADVARASGVKRALFAEKKASEGE